MKLGYSRQILILIPCIIDYIEINQLNALNYVLLYFSFAMAPTCFGKTMHLVVYLLSSLYSTPVCRFRQMSCDLSPTILTLKWLRKENRLPEDGIVLPKHVGAI
jgi:hypothetical protein